MTRAVTLAEIADTNTFVVDGTNVRVGINSSIPTTTLDVGGAVKATSFTGDGSGLTGIANTAIINADQINVTGVVTATSFVGNVTGVAATFTGNVSVGGVLTYEDVTNIDSIGIITARSGVSIGDSIFHTGDTNTAIRFPAADTFTVETAGTERVRITSAGLVRVPDNGKFTAGAGDDLQIYHDGTTSIITGDSSGDNISIRPKTGENGILLVPNSAVTLYHDDSAKLATSASGVTVTGGATFTNDVKLGDFSTGGTSTTGCFLQNEGIIYVQRVASSSEGVFRVYAGTSVNVKIDANGDSVFGSTLVSSSTGFGVQLDIAANAGTVIAQCQSTASQYTELYKGFFGTTKCFSVAANGALTITGALSKGSGSFKIDHPLPAKTGTHHLVHSFIEGPQADLIYRGYVDLVDGQATVNIDTAARMTEGTFEVLCTNVSCFTSNESSTRPLRDLWGVL
jgi:hypothetical protein